MTNRVGRKGGLDSMRLPEFEALARVGLRSNGRIYSNRRIFVDSNSIRIYIYRFEVRSNFFTNIRRIFDGSTNPRDFTYILVSSTVFKYILIFLKLFRHQGYQTRDSLPHLNLTNLQST
jgi:hypothetical protein